VPSDVAIAAGQVRHTSIAPENFFLRNLLVSCQFSAAIRARSRWYFYGAMAI
jgi:hypothetical protein